MTTRSNTNVSNWEWDNGYLSESTENEYPLRVTHSGNRLEMTLFEHNQGHLSLCGDNDEEFLVILSAPGDTSYYRSQFRVPMSTNSFLEMEPKMTITSEALRSYTPRQRECFFNSERRLAFFKTFSDKNCIYECVSNYTAMVCGCVPFNMPRMYYTYFAFMYDCYSICD